MEPASLTPRRRRPRDRRNPPPVPCLPPGLTPEDGALLELDRPRNHQPARCLPDTDHLTRYASRTCHNPCQERGFDTGSGVGTQGNSAIAAGPGTARLRAGRGLRPGWPGSWACARGEGRVPAAPGSLSGPVAGVPSLLGLPKSPPQPGLEDAQAGVRGQSCLPVDDEADGLLDAALRGDGVGQEEGRLDVFPAGL